MNPFGTEDDEFEVNEIIDDYLQTSYLIVDEMYAKHPPLEKDKYWGTVNIDLPYTQASIKYQDIAGKFGHAVPV